MSRGSWVGEVGWSGGVLEWGYGSGSMGVGVGIIRLVGSTVLCIRWDVRFYVLGGDRGDYR